VKKVRAMPRRIDEEQEDWEDDDPDWSDGEDDLDVPPEEAGDPTIPCPYCHRLVHEDSQRCPYCEQYISREDAPPVRKAWWIIVGALLGLYVVFRWIVWP
jgi:hypothetical protein